jgi:hypothetical protein
MVLHSISDEIWGRAKVCRFAARSIADYLVHDWNHRNACKRSGAVLPPEGSCFRSGRARGRWRCCYSLIGNMMMNFLAGCTIKLPTAAQTHAARSAYSVARCFGHATALCPGACSLHTALDMHTYQIDINSCNWTCLDQLVTIMLAI